jgi:hypothetical protein
VRLLAEDKRTQHCGLEISLRCGDQNVPHRSKIAQLVDRDIKRTAVALRYNIHAQPAHA